MCCGESGEYFAAFEDLHGFPMFNPSRNTAEVVPQIGHSCGFHESYYLS
jgi:hypothetical protein